MTNTLGAYSEVGVLKTVMVCHPGLAHERLTPSNCADLLYDDVIWVERAKRDHKDFVMTMEERGVNVLEMHDLLEDVLDIPEGRKYILDRRIVPGYVGVLMAREARPWLDEMPSRQLAAHLIGGIRPDLLPVIEQTGTIETAVIGLGGQGTRHAGMMKAFGSDVVGGVAPGRAGELPAGPAPLRW